SNMNLSFLTNIVCHMESQDTDRGELAKDLLSIVIMFTARHNGLRA
ncbi:25400_t:CDS:1, partial [Gigaspora rosea]